METLTTNKKFIKVCTILGGLLALFVLILIINGLKESRYIGHGQGGVNTITVSADADVTAVPDIAVITVNLEKEGKTSKEASASLNTMLTKTMDYLKSQKIEDKDIKSEYGGVTPKYDYGQAPCLVGYPCPTKSPSIVGYTATQSITIKVRAADNANEVRTGLSGIGITNISGPTFSIDDEDMLKDQARAKAIVNAKEKAEVLAKQLGVHLGNVVTFSENSGGYPMMYATKAMDGGVSAMAERAPELPKGENKITSNVTITYEIR